MTGWYTSGLPNGRALRVRISELATPADFREAVVEFFAALAGWAEFAKGVVDGNAREPLAVILSAAKDPPLEAPGALVDRGSFVASLLRMTR